MSIAASRSDESGPGETVRVWFTPVGRRGPCPRGLNLLQCAQSLGVGLSAICGGRGTCGRCRVAIVSGALSPVTSIEQSFFSAEELAAGVRLACQAVPLSDCVVHVPEESLNSAQRIQLEGLQPLSGAEPPLTDHHIAVAPPTLEDLRSDADRLLAALAETGAECGSIDLETVRTAPSILRSQDWTVQATVRGNRLVAVGPWPSPTLGLAVDLGTTKLAAYLLDLSTGATLAARGAMNPQIRAGEDVVTRISHALTAPGGAQEMAVAATSAINDLVIELCGDADMDPARVLEAVVVGNTAMHHLLLGLPVGQLSRAPYVPALSDALDIGASELRIHIGRSACVHLPPVIAGFVGSDHVAALLATNACSAEEALLVVDIGTNTEVCLAVGGRLTSASCASGPAFEGGHIRDGMRAAAGAIEHVQLDGGEVRLQVVENAEPVGVCGSGILDALAQMVAHGVTDATGRLKREHPRVRHGDASPEFVLVPEEQRGGKAALSVTQADVRQLQLAKAAIATGIQALLEHEGLEARQLISVIVAGAFGSYIDVRSAVVIGMLPSIPLERFRQVGNAAGAGAKMMLASMPQRERGRALARRAGYLELATSPSFMHRFVDNTALRPF